MRKKKLFSLIASVILTFNLVLSSALPANAVTYDLANGISTNEMIQGMNNELKSMNNVRIRKAATQNSCFYNIKSIVKLASWVDCLQKLRDEEKGKTILGFSQESINYEEQKLIQDITEFNEFYGKDNDKYIKVELMKSGIADGKFDYNALMTDVQKYLTTTMDKMLKDNSNDAKKASEKNKKALKYIYYICDTNNSVAIRFNSMLPKDDEGKLLFTYKPESGAKSVRDLITSGNYKDLINQGRLISEKDIKEITKGDVDSSKGLLKLFLEGAEEKDGKVTYSKVSSLWYLYFSGSAIYKPFSSKVGGTEIKSALNEVYGTKGEDNDMIKTFNEAIRYRKPLYIAETNISNKITGSAKMVTLKDLIEKVDNSEKCALTLPKGVWDKAPDSNSYVYYKKNNIFNKSGSSSTASTGTDAKSGDTKSTDKSTSTGQSKDNTTLDYYGNATKEITDSSLLTEPVVKLGSSMGTSQLDTCILSNILQSVSNMENFEPSTQLLYMDVFGDIVLADGTVVYPGSANATLVQSDKNYYPYTTAFLGSYPGLSTSKRFATSTSNPEGKTIFALYGDIASKSTKNADDMDTVDGAYVDKTSKFKLKSFTLQDSKGIKTFTETNYTKYLDCKTYGLDDDVESLITFRNYQFDSGKWLEKPLEAIDNLNNWYIMSKNADVGADSSLMSLYVADPATLDSKELASVVKNYYFMAMSDENGELCSTPDNRWDNKVIGDSIIVEALNGLPNIEGFVNFRQTNYDEMVKDGSNRFKVMFMGITEDVMKGIYTIEGVVGLQNAFQSPMLAKVVSYARAYMYFIIVVLLIGVAFMFMRQNYDVLQAAIACLVISFTCWLFVSIIPVYIPIGFNGALNLLTADKSSNLGYITLMQHMEDYDTTYGKGSVNENVSISNTSSINLYKYNKADLQKIASDTGMEMENILQGTPIVIDSSAGIYIEGDTLKCSLDKLFYNSPIVGEYKAIGAGKYYYLESKKAVSSCFEYYSPYYIVTDALINKLNNFNMVFPASRETINYGKMSKDSFTMRNYITSIPFLEPDVADDKITEQYDPDIADSAKNYMGNYSDTFGLKEMFKNRLNGKAKDSLWYKTMEANGRLTDDQINTIVDKTTLNTKNFLIENYDKLQYMSDENIIKITALYETISLDRQMGMYYSEMYPMYMNLEEFSLGDILTATYVNDRAYFRFKNLSLADYMVSQHGVVWGGLFGISSVVSYVILNMITYEIPILYIVLGVLLAIKYIMKWESKKLVKGYIRGVVLIFVAYFIHCWEMILIANTKVSPISIMIPLIINLTILDMLIRYAYTIFKNPFDLGGSRSFREISPWIANVTGLTGLLASVGGAVGAAVGVGGSVGAGGIERGRDQYRHYRDINGYEEYAGQDAIIGKVMRKQEQNRTNRSYVVNPNGNSNGNSDNSGRVYHKQNNSSNTTSKSEYSEYRE